MGTVGDDRVRDTHDAVDGDAIPFNSDFLVGGRHMSRPGDFRGGFAEIIDCRYSLALVRKGPDGQTDYGPGALFKQLPTLG